MKQTIEQSIEQLIESSIEPSIEPSAKQLEFSEKTEKFNQILDAAVQSDVVVAFSGGVDSAALLKAVCVRALQYHTTVHAVTIQTRLHPGGETDLAKRVAKEIGARHHVLNVDELNEAGIAHNPVDRCYLCKRLLFERIKVLAAELGATCIMDGTNYDDLFVYRPGLKALEELGICSPLAQAGMSKEDVRMLAASFGLSVSHKPAMPCMATRFPYGTTLSYEAMEKVEQAEQMLRDMGFYNVRVRIHGNTARIEVDTVDLKRMIDVREKVVDLLKQLGYDYIVLDLEGFRSGSMDIHIRALSESREKGGK